MFQPGDIVEYGPKAIFNTGEYAGVVREFHKGGTGYNIDIKYDYIVYEEGSWDYASSLQLRERPVLIKPIGDYL